jgi:hypothetical protein
MWNGSRDHLTVDLVKLEDRLSGYNVRRHIDNILVLVIRLFLIFSRFLNIIIFKRFFDLCYLTK